MHPHNHPRRQHRHHGPNPRLANVHLASRLATYAITLAAAVGAAIVLVGTSQCQGAGVRNAWTTYLELDGALRWAPAFLKAVAATAMADAAARCLPA